MHCYSLVAEICLRWKNRDCATCGAWNRFGGGVDQGHADRVHAMSTPYTLSPTPYTLSPTPYTLSPKPYTLNPTPYTLSPKPYILNPTP